MKVALYARVSQDDLHCENQRLVLDEWAKRHSDEIQSSVYFQEEMSTRKTRPIKQDVLKRFREGQFDTVVVARLDRWARSMTELVQDVEGVIAQRGRFICIANGFDFQKNGYNASAQLQLSIFSAFAQFEREIIRERTLEGLARARAQGKVLGRPRKQRLAKNSPPLSDSTPISY